MSTSHPTAIPEQPRHRRAWWEFRAVILAAFAGVVLSLCAFGVIRNWEMQSLRATMHDSALEQVELLRGRLSASLELLDAVAAFCGREGPEVTRPEFRQFVTKALNRHPEIQALSWNPVVPAAERTTREAAARAEGHEGYHIWELGPRGTAIPAGLRASYVPVFLEEPVRGNERSLGFDLASDPKRRASLEHARDTGSSESTGSLRLVQEPGHQNGFLIVHPLYRGSTDTVEERRRHLTGYVSAVFRVGDLVERALANVEPGKFDLAIFEKQNDTRPIYRRMSDASRSTPLSVDELLAFPGGSWRLTFQPTARYLAANTHFSQSWTALLTGLILTLIAARHLVHSLRHTEEIEARVRERTAELSAEVARRERLEEELRKAEMKYRSLFENSVEGIFQTTLDGRYLSANPALARLYGYTTADELIGDLSDIDRRLYVQPGQRAEFIRLVQEHGSVSGFESQVRRKDGRIIWISEKARLVSGAHGEPLYYEGVAEDITDRKRADTILRDSHEALEARVQERTAELASTNVVLRAEVAERQRAELAADAANRAKSTFLAHMSHEIRTPLNAILGYAQILRRDGTFRQAHRLAIDTIASSGNHLLSLIDDVLDLSKAEAGHLQLQNAPFDLQHLLRRVETMFAQQCRQKSLALKVELAPDLPKHVSGDEGKLRQTLINLLGNAVKFTERGEVRLRVERGEAETVTFALSDTGVGIAPEQQETIFHAFQQAESGLEKGGTGLGLAIARHQVEIMGGTLRLQSTPGAGSRFSFTIPLAHASPDSAAESVGEATLPLLAPGRTVRALVVDDVAANRDVLAAMLRSIGCEVAVAADGEDALAHARAERPDIVFVDVWLPGLDGVETARQIHAQCGVSIRLIAHSASAFDLQSERAREAGIDDFLAKPFRAERVVATLRQWLSVDFVEPAETRAPASSSPGRQRELLRQHPELATRMRTAAEFSSLTDLQICISELAQIGPAGKELSTFLQPWLENCDLAAISQWLEAQRAPLSDPAAIIP